jgi:hypothetical protein
MGLKALGDPVPDRAFLGVAFRWMATGNWLFAWPWRGLGPVLLTVLPYLKYLWARTMRHRTATPIRVLELQLASTTLFRDYEP